MKGLSFNESMSRRPPRLRRRSISVSSTDSYSSGDTNIHYYLTDESELSSMMDLTTKIVGMDSNEGFLTRFRNVGLGKSEVFLGEKMPVFTFLCFDPCVTFVQISIRYRLCKRGGKNFAIYKLELKWGYFVVEINFILDPSCMAGSIFFKIHSGLQFSFTF